MEIVKKNYTVTEAIRNAITILCNIIQFGGRVRLIRYPIIIRGKKYIDWGKRLTTGYNCRIEVNGKHEKPILTFGKNVNR